MENFSVMEREAEARFEDQIVLVDFTELTCAFTRSARRRVRVTFAALQARVSLRSAD